MNFIKSILKFILPGLFLKKHIKDHAYHQMIRQEAYDCIFTTLAAYFLDAGLLIHSHNNNTFYVYGHNTDLIFNTLRMPIYSAFSDIQRRWLDRKGKHHKLSYPHHWAIQETTVTLNGRYMAVDFLLSHPKEGIYNEKIRYFFFISRASYERCCLATDQENHIIQEMHNIKSLIE